ncbi:hypothetical protein QZM22_02490 [Burkholderia oklahomensis]|uniref:hypothetical protein n=1 Tax=Burkholderia oklahomensis TaxID=342113 RepID=UPI00265618E1|nr:hypothetical protein [Burkholderia oklahomensis]MDN7671415.1 hypothetical protein [Burkholderia oklahomensis]
MFDLAFTWTAVRDAARRRRANRRAVAHVPRAFILGRDAHRGRARAPAAALPAAGIAIRSLDARHDKPSIGGARPASLRWINSIGAAYFVRARAAEACARDAGQNGAGMRAARSGSIPDQDNEARSAFCIFFRKRRIRPACRLPLSPAISGAVARRTEAAHRAIRSRPIDDRARKNGRRDAHHFYRYLGDNRATPRRNTSFNGSE